MPVDPNAPLEKCEIKHKGQFDCLEKTIIHCGACGKVACSKHRRNLATWGPFPVYQCDDCYNRDQELNAFLRR